MTKKRTDFLLRFFMKKKKNEALQLIINKDHLTEEGIRKMVSIRASINKGLTNILKEAFPDVKPMVISSSAIELTVQLKTTINPY